MAGFPGGAEVKVSACNVGDLVRSLGREDPLEKEMATHCSILAWRIPCMEELGGLQSTGRRESDTTERLHFTMAGTVLNPGFLVVNQMFKNPCPCGA